MPDSDLQLDISRAQSRSGSRVAALASDSYSLLLVVGLLVLVVSLAGLGYVWFSQYGLGEKPVIGQITGVSETLVQIDIGAKEGLQGGQTLSAMRRGVFLTNLSIKSVADNGCSAVPVAIGPDGKLVEGSGDGQGVTLAKGDMVVSHPLD